MPEQKKPQQQSGVAEPDQQAVPASSAGSGGSPSLGKAGESSDPVVQDLLARREIALRNEDKGAVKALTAELKELGVE